MQEKEDLVAAHHPSTFIFLLPKTAYFPFFFLPFVSFSLHRALYLPESARRS